MRQLNGRLMLPGEDVRVHLVNDGAVLFERDRQALFTANATAAAVWCGLEQKFPPASVADGMTERFGLDLTTARTYVAQTLRQWRRERRSDVRTFDLGPAPDPADVLPANDIHDTAIRRAVLQPMATAETRSYRMLDTVFSIRFERGGLARDVDETLGHLRHDGPPDAVGASFDVRHVCGSAVLSEYDDIIECCTDEAHAVAMVRACVIDRALEDCRDLAALHAAAAIRGDKCILLPGLSGVGKSTLAAGLAAEGFILLGDDVVTICRESFAVRPVPCGICLKENSWELLATRFPEVRRLAVHARPDHHRVKYVTPPTVNLAHGDVGADVGWIVFPTFDADGPTELLPISGIGVFDRLLTCFEQLGDGLNEAEVEGLIGWVMSRPCYSLRVSSLTEAVRLLSFLDA